MRKNEVLFVLIVVLSLCGFWAASASATGGVESAEGGEKAMNNPQGIHQVVITRKTFQTMDGFGVSGAWVAGHIREWLNPEAQREVLDALFTEAGANLSILRVKIEPSIDSRGHDPGSEFLLAEAQRRGVTQFYAVPWTPPSEWEDESNQLKEEFNDEYAQFLADYLKLFRDRGIHIKWLSAQNEPDLSCEYESCAWTELAMSNFVHVLRETLNNNGLTDVHLVAPEAMGWAQTNTYVKLLLELGGDEHVGVWASHGYWGMERNEEMDAYRENISALAQQNNKTVWMTEWSDLNAAWHGDPNDPSVLGLGDGLLWADRIANDLVKANVSAWMYWWIYNPNPVNFPNSANEGILVRTPENTFLYPKRFYTFSQFSRFIRPGAQRIEVTDHPADLKIVAFQDVNRQQIIVVAVNSTESERPLNLALNGFIVTGNAQVFRTSENENVAPLPEVGVGGNSLSVNIVARSVTTFVIPADVS